MTPKRALLLVKVDLPSKDETAWNSWYNSKHIPARLAVPGFLSARRFTRIEGIPKAFCVPGDPKYLTLYDTANIDVLRSEPYRKLWEKESLLPADSFEKVILTLPKLARGIYEQIFPEQGEYKPPKTKYVLILGHEIPRNKKGEFNAWYNTEHIPAMMRVPGFVTARRFMLNERDFPPMLGSGGVLSRYLTVYDIENENIFESEVFVKESQSPWSTWVRKWFSRKMCAVYQRIYPQE